MGELGRAARGHPGDEVSMGKRRLKLSGAEQDAFTTWRRLYCYLSRTGVIGEIKRDYRRRERNRARQDIREGKYE